MTVVRLGRGAPSARAHTKTGAKTKAKRQRSAVGAMAGRTSALVLWGVVLTLAGIGLAMVISASTVTSLYDGSGTWDTAIRHSVWLGLGLVAMAGLGRFDYHHLKRVVPALMVLSVAALLAVLIPSIGIEANGSRRWIGIGPLTFQPAELAKLTAILYTAYLMDARSPARHPVRATVNPVLLVIGVAAALLLAQPDLGSAIVLVGVVFAMLYTAGAPALPLARWFVIGTVVASILAYAEPYRRRRLFAFVDPWNDPLDTGYQTIQSLVGIASGGLMGVGIGEGRAKWGYLPFAHTDFIYAVVAEEMGFGGALLVLAMFVVLGTVGCMIAMRARDHFGRLLAVGITVWILAQALINIGAVVGVMPITGIPLPFMSFGGTALITTMAAVGILINIARQAPE